MMEGYVYLVIQEGVLFEPDGVEAVFGDEARAKAYIDSRPYKRKHYRIDRLEVNPVNLANGGIPFILFIDPTNLKVQVSRFVDDQESLKEVAAEKVCMAGGWFCVTLFARNKQMAIAKAREKFNYYQDNNLLCTLKDLEDDDDDEEGGCGG